VEVIDISAAGQTDIRSAVGLATANLDTQLDALPTAAENADAVWDEDATAHQTQGTFGQAIGDPAADTNSIFKAVVTDATGATVGVDVVAIKAETAAIVADTNELQTDWANGGRLDLIVDSILEDTGTTLQGELDGIQADTEDIQARLPAALVSGRIDASVGAMAANVMTAAAAAADLTTELQAGLSTLDAAGVRAAVGLASANLDTQLSTIDTVVDAVLVDTAEIGAAGAGLTALATQASVNTVDTVVDAIKAKTDSLTFTVAGFTDVNLLKVNGVTIIGDGSGTPFNVA
jgi:hypothetical protein